MQGSAAEVKCRWGTELGPAKPRENIGRSEKQLRLRDMTTNASHPQLP